MNENKVTTAEAVEFMSYYPNSANKSIEKKDIEKMNEEKKLLGEYLNIEPNKITSASLKMNSGGHVTGITVIIDIDTGRLGWNTIKKRNITKLLRKLA